MMVSETQPSTVTLDSDNQSPTSSQSPTNNLERSEGYLGSVTGFLNTHKTTIAYYGIPGALTVVLVASTVFFSVAFTLAVAAFAGGIAASYYIDEARFMDLRTMGATSAHLFSKDPQETKTNTNENVETAEYTDFYSLPSLTPSPMRDETTTEAKAALIVSAILCFTVACPVVLGLAAGVTFGNGFFTTGNIEKKPIKDLLNQLKTISMDKWQQYFPLEPVENETYYYSAEINEPVKQEVE